MVDLSNVVFQWGGSGGADQYVVEVSTSPMFVRDQTWVGKVFNKGRTSTDGTLISERFTNVLNNAPELASLPVGTTLYWRVGARCSQDTPGPVPSGPSPQFSGEKATRFIYTGQDQLFTFQIGGQGSGPDYPPPPPG